MIGNINLKAIVLWLRPNNFQLVQGTQSERERERERERGLGIWLLTSTNTAA